jgi:hypothetical protein
MAKDRSNEYRKWQDSLSTSADADNVIHFIRARAKAHWPASPHKNTVFVSYDPEALAFTVRMGFRPSSNEFFHFVDEMRKAFVHRPSAARSATRARGTSSPFHVLLTMTPIASR